MTNKEYEDWFGIPLDYIEKDNNLIKEKKVIFYTNQENTQNTPLFQNEEQNCRKFIIDRKCGKLTIRTKKSKERNNIKSNSERKHIYYFRNHTNNSLNVKNLNNKKYNELDQKEERIQRCASNDRKSCSKEKRGRKKKIYNDYIMTDGKVNRLLDKNNNHYLEYANLKLNCNKILEQMNNINNFFKKIEILEKQNIKMSLDDDIFKQEWFLNYKSKKKNFYKNTKRRLKILKNKDEFHQLNNNITRGDNGSDITNILLNNKKRRK